MNWGFGAWDSDKCTTVMSEQHSTVCECYTDGTFGKYLLSSIYVCAYFNQFTNLGI